MPPKTEVLVVNDSATIRQELLRIFSVDAEIEVMGTVLNPFAAALKLRDRVPGVILLDQEMPHMNGLAFLEKIMRQHPIPVVMCIDADGEEGRIADAALKLGAVAVLILPLDDVRGHLREESETIRRLVKRAATTRPRRRSFTPPKVTRKLSADVILPAAEKRVSRRTQPVIVIGASTGGTEALRELLMALPVTIPGIIVVQHMPDHFTAILAENLNKTCKITVREARDGDRVRPGTALIAPGGSHTLLLDDAAGYHVAIREGPPVNRHRPAVDVLFRSAAASAGWNAVGVILTGMGDDGAACMAERRRHHRPG